MRKLEGLDRVIGDVPAVFRLPTGLWSLDKAVGWRNEVGFPGRSLVELYGPEGCGKSTLAYYVSAKYAGERELWIADLEGSMDKVYIEHVTRIAGHTGIIRIMDYTQPGKKKGSKVMRPHAVQLQEAIDGMLEEKVGAGVADSIGSFYGEVAKEKRIDEKDVGNTAYTINNATRRVAAWHRITADLQQEPKIFFFINHTSPNIGGRGFDTPGGQKKKYLSNVRAWIRRFESNVPEGSGNFVAEVMIHKLKYGASGGKGLVYFIPGYGVSREMTVDCIRLGIAKREATVKLRLLDGDDKTYKWTSMGRISTLAKYAEQPDKHRAVFQRFTDALENYDG